MSISLSGEPQPYPACTTPPHEWEIKGIHQYNPRTGKRYGTDTPGTCRKCGQERIYDSRDIQHSKDDFIVTKR